MFLEEAWAWTDDIEMIEFFPISFLEKHLGKIMTDENQLHAVLEYLKENREIKVSNELKRSYK